MTDWWDSALFELDGLEFGRVPSPLRTFSWDAGDLTYRARDWDRPHTPGRILGLEQTNAPTWRIGLRTLAGGEVGAHEQVARLAAVWVPPADRALVVLRYRLAERWRRVYGRPRRMVLPTTGFLAHLGRADVVAEFDLASPLHFSDDASTVRLPIVPASPHGLRFTAVGGPPLRWASADGEPAVRAVTVGGDAPAPVTVTVHGPLSAGWVRIGGTTVRLGVDLAYDEQVTVDALAMSITRGDGASWPGALAASTRMADLYLPPGTHDAYLGGIDVTGTAWASVTWRDAWRSL